MVRRRVVTTCAAAALVLLTVAPAGAQVSPPTSAALRVEAPAPARSAAQARSTADQGLPKTGSDVDPLVAMGVGLAAAGGGMVVLARRRSSASSV